MGGGIHVCDVGGGAYVMGVCMSDGCTSTSINLQVINDRRKVLASLVSARYLLQ